MSKKQLRGEELKKVIKEGIYYLAKQHENYKYNASELSKQINVSRMTLSKYSNFIDEVLEEIMAEKKVVSGEGMINQLAAKIERLEKEKEELQKENDALKSDYSDVFQRVYENSGSWL